MQPRTRAHPAVLLASLLLAGCGELGPPASAPAVPPGRVERAGSESRAPAATVLVRPRDDAPPEPVEPVRAETFATPAPPPPASPSGAAPQEAGARARAGGQHRGERPDKPLGDLSRVPVNRSRDAPENAAGGRGREAPESPLPQDSGKPGRRRDRRP